jgi:hypothetical protein
VRGVAVAAVAFGLLSAVTLVGILAHLLVRHRATKAEALRRMPLARFTWSPQQWDVFLRRERKKHLESAAMFAGIVGTIATVLWGGCAGGFSGGGGGMAGGAKVFAVALAFALALAIGRCASRHYFTWSRRRGDVALFSFGIAIGGVLLDWTTDDLHLRDAVMSPTGDALELVFSRRNAGDGPDYWYSEVLAVPLPTSVDGAALARRLTRTAGPDEES